MYRLSKNRLAKKRKEKRQPLSVYGGGLLTFMKLKSIIKIILIS